MTSRKEKTEESQVLSSDPSAVATASDPSPAPSPSSSRRKRASGQTTATTADAPRPARKSRGGKAAAAAQAADTPPADMPAASPDAAASRDDATPAKPAARRGRRTPARSAASERPDGAETPVTPDRTSPDGDLSARADAAAPARPARAARSSAKGRRAAATSPAASSAPSGSGAQTDAGDSPSGNAATEEAAAPKQAKSRSARGKGKSTKTEAAAPAAAEAGGTAGEPAPLAALSDATAEKQDDAARQKSSRGGRKRQRQEKKNADREDAAPSTTPALEQYAIIPPAVQEKSLVPALLEQTLPVPVETEAAGTASEDAEAVAGQDEDGTRRKSRRGRRGGRGRNRRNRQPGEAGEGPVAAEATSDATPDESGEIPADDETAEPVKKGGVRAAAVKAKAAAATGRQRMFISILPGEQVEVALAEEGVLLEYYLDMLHQKKLKGNIYKGVIHNIDTNLQAAFVSYGAGKNGFLQIDEVHPEYWLAHHEPAKGKKYPPIQKVLKAGQEVLVQVVKEPNGSKGAFLTTWLSLAGRFLVLTPGQEQIGVSRKVDNDEERTRLREMMNGIEPGEGLGVIVRTVSAGVTKTILRSDLQYLKRVWRDIRKKATEVSAPALIHEEPGLPERAVRDYLTDEVCEIWVDNEALADSIRDTVSQLFPRKKDLVRLHSDSRHTLWERFNLRRQLDQIYAREVTLPSGGRLVFDQTEALMAVDINSGKISGKVNFESMAFKTNMEAAETIARQLKLRDIGGQVVIDFIEMRDRKHVQEVEKTLRTAMKNDRARHDVGRMSSFGLLELVRQRMGSSALAISMEPCPHCNGTGQRRNREWQALQALRDLRSRLRTCQEERLRFEATAEVGLYLLNDKRDTLRDLENSFGKGIEICLRP